MKRGSLVTATGVLVAPYRTPRPEWLRFRQEGIGGSDALAVLGLDPWRTRMEVYLDKIGELPERDATPGMRWGSLVEDSIARWFAAETGIGVRRCGLMRHVDRPWQRVSVDRLTGDGGILEIKNTGYWRRGDWAEGQVADGAEAQGQHAMAVTGRSHVWFAAQIGGQPPEFRRIEHDDRFIADLTVIEAEFWALVQARTPPALEGGRAAADLVARMFPVADPASERKLEPADLDVLREYAAALADENAAKQRKDSAKAVITSLMGTADRAVYDGETVAAWDNRSKVSCDHKHLAAEWPEIAAQVLTSKAYRQFANKFQGET